MKVLVKVYQGDEFQVEAEPSDTIAELKVKIHASRGYPIEKQTILFCAKVPADDRTLESCRINDNCFIALLIAKPRLPMPEPKPVDILDFRRPAAEDKSGASDSAPEVASTPGLENKTAVTHN